MGSNFVTHWGSVGYFGPLTVHPDFWDRGVGQKLPPTRPGVVRGLGLPPHRPLHLLRQPQAPGALPEIRLLAPGVDGHPLQTGPAGGDVGEVSLYSQAEAPATPRAGGGGAGLTDAIYAGLNVEREILALHGQGLGDAVLIWDDPGLVGSAAVHVGAGSEAGSGAGFVKFGAARPGPKAAEYFDRLLTACEAYAAAQGAQRLIAGISLARQPAYEQMRTRGFQPEVVGVCMHKPNEPATLGKTRLSLMIGGSWMGRKTH